LLSIYETGEYHDLNPQWHVEDSAWKALQVLKMLDKHDLRPSTVAEAGCGAGEILRQLQLALPQETRFSGYDVSPQAIDHARGRENAGLKFYLEDLAAQDVYFDLLLVIDVFEHVDDYLGFLRRLASKATQMIFHIPLDLSAQTVFREQSLLKTRREVGHLHYFTEGTALATLQDTGYEIDDYFFTARAVELRGGGAARTLARLPRRLVAMLSPGLASKVLGGFSLLVLARPKSLSAAASRD